MQINKVLHNILTQFSSPRDGKELTYRGQLIGFHVATLIGRILSRKTWANGEILFLTFSEFSGKERLYINIGSLDSRRLKSKYYFCKNRTETDWANSYI